MSDGHGISENNLMSTLPVALERDKRAVGLARAAAKLLAARPEEIKKLAIYSGIDELPEELLDILAYDFKVDWWDGEYTLEEKRRTLKESWFVHRTLGTKAAVERALSAIYPGAEVREWFEYDGEPYHFKLSIDTTNDKVNDEKRRRVLERVEYYKNLRSHMDGIEYYAGAEAVGKAAAGAVCRACLAPVYARVENIPEELKGVRA